MYQLETSYSLLQVSTVAGSTRLPNEVCGLHSKDISTCTSTNRMLQCTLFFSSGPMSICIGQSCSNSSEDKEINIEKKVNSCTHSHNNHTIDRQYKEQYSPTLGCHMTIQLGLDLTKATLSVCVSMSICV